MLKDGLTLVSAKYPSSSIQSPASVRAAKMVSRCSAFVTATTASEYMASLVSKMCDSRLFLACSLAILSSSLCWRAANLEGDTGIQVGQWGGTTSQNGY